MNPETKNIEVSNISKKQLLALKAVLYGANTNKKLVGGEYMIWTESPQNSETIPFVEAIQIIMKLISEIEENNTNDTTQHNK